MVRREWKTTEVESEHSGEFHAPEPVPPLGEGWRLVTVTFAENTRFSANENVWSFFWEREVQ